MAKILIGPLNPALNLHLFDSGNKDVNDFLKLKAKDEELKKITKIFAIQIENQVIAYAAVFCTHYRLMLHDQNNAFRVPGLFIGQLGVDLKYQGKGLGRILIKHCISLVHTISEFAGCRILFLEAVDNKLEFYSNFRFQFIEKRPNRNKMYLDVLL